MQATEKMEASDQNNKKRRLTKTLKKKNRNAKKIVSAENSPTNIHETSRESANILCIKNTSKKVLTY